MRLLQRLAVLLCVSSAPLGARAEVIPVDPRALIDQLRAYYQASPPPPPERVDIKVASEGQVRTDSLSIVFAPGGAFHIEFGSYKLWREGGVIRVVHRLDERLYLETPVKDGDVFASLAEVVPPFPLPQLGAALAPDSHADLTPYARGIRWARAEVHPDTKPPTAIARGENERAAAELTIDANSGRLLRMTIELDGGRTRIDITGTPLAPGEVKFGADISRRELTTDLGDMKPRGGDIRVGDALPDLGLLIWRDDSEWPVELKGPGALVLFRRWNPGTTPVWAISAAQTLETETPGFSVWPAIVLSMLDTEPLARIVGAGADLVVPLNYSYSPETSIERFTRSADVVVVVIGPDNTVKKVIESAPTAPAGAGDELLAEIRAALKQ